MASSKVTTGTDVDPVTVRLPGWRARAPRPQLANGPARRPPRPATRRASPGGPTRVGGRVPLLTMSRSRRPRKRQSRLPAAAAPFGCACDELPGSRRVDGRRRVRSRPWSATPSSRPTPRETWAISPGPVPHDRGRRGTRSVARVRRGSSWKRAFLTPGGKVRSIRPGKDVALRRPGRTRAPFPRLILGEARRPPNLGQLGEEPLDGGRKLCRTWPPARPPNSGVPGRKAWNRVSGA